MTSFDEKIKRELERYNEMKKFDDFNRFKALLKDFSKNPKQYDRIVIRADFVGAKRGCYAREMFDGSEAIKEYCDEIWEAMMSLLNRYDIFDCLEGEFMTIAYFNDDSDADHKKIISVFFFKN